MFTTTLALIILSTMTVAVVTVHAQQVSPIYSPVIADEISSLAKIAYCPPNTITSDWNCGACGNMPDFKLYKLHDHSNAETLAFTGYVTSKKRIYVVFRGSDSIEDWIRDLSVLMSPYPHCNSCWVETGFLEQWNIFKSGILQDVAALHKMHPSFEIIVNGHSLGAAASLLAGLDILVQYPGLPVTVYNMGEPRVGDSAFAGWAATKLPAGRQFRITNEKDIVPHLPPSGVPDEDYIHLWHEVWYPHGGNTSFINCHDAPTREDPSCSDSLLIPSIIEHCEYLGRCTCSCDLSCSLDHERKRERFSRALKTDAKLRAKVEMAQKALLEKRQKK